MNDSKGKEGMDRRQFLKYSGAVAAGVSGSGMVLSGYQRKGEKGHTK